MKTRNHTPEIEERFFGSLKQERVQWHNYRTQYAAQQNVMNYITMCYNSQRMHSYLDYQITKVPMSLSVWRGR